jgi:inner membrane protein
MKDPNKYLFKAAVIIILIAVLMIPTMYVTSLVTERKERKVEVTNEVSKSWSGAQVVSAPFLSIPFTKKANNGNELKYKSYLTASNNSVAANVQSQTIKRGIYNVPVYNSTIISKGVFSKADIEQLIAAYGSSVLSEAKMNIVISDAKGITDSVKATINNTNYIMAVDMQNNSDNSKTIAVPIGALLTTATDVNYSITLQLRGTEKISFYPSASLNKITLSAPWKDPSFFGNVISGEKTITNNGFQSIWNISRFQTNTPLYMETLPILKDTEVGVHLINTVDGYTKTLRTTKYALLLIALTFALFFFIEAIKSKQIHPIQYGLVGLALVLFFTLLLSISEYTGFDVAYIIAGLATITLIATYAKTVLHTNANAITVAATLTALYSFVYFIIQMEEKSLLVGSIGLFLILAALMQLSKKVKWYNTVNLFNTNTPNQ